MRPGGKSRLKDKAYVRRLKPNAAMKAAGQSGSEIVLTFMVAITRSKKNVAIEVEEGIG